MNAKHKEAMKKHHFWILFGLVPLFVLIAVLVNSSIIGSEIDKRDKEIKDEEKSIKSKSNPKSNALLAAMGKMVSFIDSKQDGLWKGCYNPQKSIYTMLDSPKLKRIEKLGLKFGDRIPNENDEYEEFKKNEYYVARFKKIVEHVSPTAFVGGWDRVLRHVNSWTDVKLTSDQIWLLMEDIWVQESLLDAVNSVNTQMAEFTRVKLEQDGVVIDDPAGETKDGKAPNNKLHRKFKSRTWEIELEFVKEGNKWVARGKLTNTTDKLQMFGVGNMMVLKVWLQEGDKRSIQPFEFKISGEFLPGEGATKVLKDKDGKGPTVPANVLVIPSTPGADDHIVPDGITVDTIAAVEQAFDSKTVPIRMVQDLVLSFRDSRNTASALKLPVFIKEEAAAESSTTSGTGAGGLGMQGSGLGGMTPPGLGKGGMGGANQSAGDKPVFGGGTVATVIDGSKKRYLDATAQVRRMPVGIGLIVDQAYLQDVLLALANTPLRFQITQVTWTRFRGNLGDSEAPSSSGPGSPAIPGGGIVQSGQGMYGAGFSGMSSGAGKPTKPGSPLGPASPLGPGVGAVGPSSSFGGGSTSTVSESQLTSGLVDLKVYGIVSLYTSPEAPAVDPNADKDKKDQDQKTKDAKDKEPKGKDPNEKDAKDKDAKDKDAKDTKDKDVKDKKDEKDKDTKDKEPMPKVPAPTDPKTSKM